MASVFKKREAWIAQSVWTGTKAVASLGRLEKRDADLAGQMITELERSRAAGSTPSRTASAWLESINDRVHRGIVRLGLVDPRPVKTALPSTIAKFFKDYLDSRPDLSWRARNNIEQAGNSLGECLGHLRAVARVTPADAERWHRWLVEKNYSTSTISGHVKKAKQVFRAAIKTGVISSSPLAGLKAGEQVNDARGRYIHPEVIARVMELANPAWRLLIALSRFGGLRIPSEVQSMVWSDFKMSEGQIIIRSGKTRKIGKLERRIPMFAELLKPIAEAFDARDVESDRVFPFALANYNPHTRMKKLVRRAGFEPWPRIFHNLRASCQTDLEEQYPPQTVCFWLGNSPATSRKHYLRVTGEHWQRASAQASALNTQSVAQLAQVVKENMQNLHGNSDIAPGAAVSGYSPWGYQETRLPNQKSRLSLEASVKGSASEHRSRRKPIQRKTPEEWMKFNARRLARASRLPRLAGQEAK